MGREKELRGNSVIIPCGFGRNMWNDTDVSSTLRSLFSHADSDIERFKKLHQAEFDAGEVNRTLARACYRLASQDQLTESYAPYQVTGQWEVMYELWKHKPEWYGKYSHWFFSAIWPKYDGEYLTTRGMLELIRLGPSQNAVIVAQAIHVARCLRVADQVFGCDSVSKATVDMPNLYDAASVQPWTRDQTSFITYEKKARVFNELPRWLQNLVRHFL